MKNLISASVLIILLLTGCRPQSKTFLIGFETNNFEKKFALTELNQELPADWSSSGFLTFDLKASSTQWFDLKIYDSTGIRRVSIHPMEGPWVRASIPLVHFQKRNTKGNDLAAIGKTARPGYWIGFSGSVGSIASVDSIGFSMRQPTGAPTIELKNFCLTEEPRDTVFGPVPLVDQFGQWIPSDWPGKAKSVDDLKNMWGKEDSLLRIEDLSFSKYGGFLDKKVRATGFFRVEKINNIWWFVDPDGYLFFSHGATCIGPRAEFARTKGREYIFTEVDSSVQGDAIQKYSYYSANLYYRFGKEWYDGWKDLTIRRMHSWGLNTIANWSDPALGAMGRKPYVVTLSGWGINNGIMGMPDVFDPGYPSMVDKSAMDQCAGRKNDPWLLGYFVYNEPAWPHREQELVNEILAGAETPMKAELKRFLEGGDTPERRKEFVYLAYERFVSLVNTAIKKHDPNHLNLGMRFGGSAPDEIILASKGFDVFSFNSYGYKVSSGIIKRVSELTGQPMIIGEFHFGVPGRGLAPGLAQTADYEERAVAYKYYVENAAALPQIIGEHWFQWMDQPSTGRFDGENYNIGFIDITDRPYPEMVNASRELFKRLYYVHSGIEKPTEREAKRQ